MRRVVTLALILLALYGAVLALLYFAQGSLLYPSSGQRASAAEAGLTGFEDLVLTTPDGERLVAWWKPPQPGKTIIVYFHGNGGALWDRRFRGRALGQGGRGVLMVSYRGYSGSTGRPSEAGLRIDGRTAYDWIVRAYDPSRIVAYGESLGTGVAVRLASEHPVGGLILDSPFTSTADIAAAIYWFVPVTLLMRDQYRSIDVIGQVRAPILIMHGDRDQVVPFALGERLHAAAPEPKRFVRLPAVGHTDVLERGGLAAVDAFLTELEAPFLRPPPEPAQAPSPR